MNIKLSNTDYPQVIHNDTSGNECSSKNETGRIESPLPKLTIRIPKPIEKPLEIITTGQGSPFRNTDNESQQSPRIILKINKNTMSQTKESSTLTSTTIIATDELQARSNSPHLLAKQNEVKRSNHDFSSEISMKKQKLNVDVVQLVSSDSEYDDKDQQSTPNKHRELCQESYEDQQTLSTISENIQKASFEMTTNPASNTSTSFNTNSGLRSILSRPQMKIQPSQTLQSFLQTLPTFKNVATDAAATATSIDDGPKLNDVIDLCHDSNDRIEESSLNDELMLHETKEVQNELDENLTKNLQEEDEIKQSSYSWQYFYSESEKEKIQPIHPLLQQHTERANVLTAMMEAANEQESSTNGGDNNDMAIADGFEQTNSSNHLLIENEGSSSDCIVIEDTASEPFPSEYTGVCNMAERNGNKKECVDRDSGVDVSNSVKSIVEENSTATVKRPRGRPRKGIATTASVK